MNPDSQNQAQGQAPPEPTVMSIRTSSPFTQPSDPSQYIRTFAKDVAKLTNTPIPEPAALPQQAGPKEGEKSAQEFGVSLPGFDPSPIEHADAPSSPKEFEQEDLDLTASDSDGLFKTKDDAVSEREAILSRLREKVQGGKGGVSLAPTAPELPMRASAPTFASAEPVPLAPLPPIIKPIPIEEPLREIPPPIEPIVRPALAPVIRPEPKPTTPSPIHTFSTDFADRIDEQKSSTFEVLAAQSDAGQTVRPARPKQRGNVLPLIAGMAMVFIGIGAIYGTYLYIQKNGPVQMVAGVPSLITFDESVEVHGSGTALLQALADASQGAGVSGNVVVTYVTASGNAGIDGPQPGGVLVRALQLPAPDILLRNIDDTSTVGFIRAGTESRPFFILKVNSYERTFAGMLAWEATIVNDLGAIYPAYAGVPQTPASSTASTTASVGYQPVFADAVVDNYDVRALRDQYGRTLMLYGYRGKDLLIIARDEAAFTALATRLANSGH